MHNLIVGITHSGKSELAKEFTRNMPPEQVVIFDPRRSANWPQGTIKFSDPKKFFEYVENAESKYVFCDEAKDFWNEGYQKEAEKLLTQSRHNGQLIFLIAQRAKMIPPTARAQCSNVFAFRQNLDDSIELAREYHSSMREIPQLPEHHFIFSNGFESSTHKLNFENYPPKIENI